LTANLAVLLAKSGKRVGIVDCDVQSPGVHVIFQVTEDRVRFFLNDYLFGKCAIEQAAFDVTSVSIGAASPEDERPKIFLVPSSTRARDIGRVLKEGYDVALLNDGFKRLVDKLQLDFLLLDTHPGVNEETLLSIVISDRVILILRPDSQDFQGILVTLELAKRLGVEDPWLVLNKIPPGMDMAALKKKVEESYGRRVVGLLPLNHEIVRLASSGIFTNRFPDHPFTLEVQHIAKLLLAEGQE
jgi:MinD-like ATPase involved in chromosome partitioning or flagellar assembly